MTGEARTRNAQKKARRARRQAAERETAAAKARRERLWLIASVVATLALVVSGAVWLTMTSDDTDTPSVSSDSDAVPVDEAGLQIGPPPWEARTEGFTERVSALGFPPVGDESYHAHALLSVFRNGQQTPVPPVLGFSADGQHASLHTHYPNGVIHLEADDPYPYSIKDVFTVWGVRFSTTQLGSDTAADADKVHVYVNGKPASDGPDTKIRDGDNIVVAFGAAGSFPASPDLTPLTDEVRGS